MKTIPNDPDQTIGTGVTGPRPRGQTNQSPPSPGGKPFAKKRGANTIIDTPSMRPPQNTSDDARIHAELISTKGRHTGHSRKGR